VDFFIGFRLVFGANNLSFVHSKKPLGDQEGEGIYQSKKPIVRVGGYTTYWHQLTQKEFPYLRPRSNARFRGKRYRV
jgi:hypothetical protein